MKNCTCELFDNSSLLLSNNIVKYINKGALIKGKIKLKLYIFYSNFTPIKEIKDHTSLPLKILTIFKSIVSS